MCEIMFCTVTGAGGDPKNMHESEYSYLKYSTITYQTQFSIALPKILKWRRLFPAFPKKNIQKRRLCPPFNKIETSLALAVALAWRRKMLVSCGIAAGGEAESDDFVWEEKMVIYHGTK